MPTSGSGTITPVSAALDLTGACPNLPDTHISIEEYWDYLQINEIAGYGIRNFPTTGVLGMGCGDYWDQKERYWILSSIQKAENRMEADRWLGFPIRRKYFELRQMEYSYPAYLGKYVRGIGIEANSLIVQNKPMVLRTAGVINDPVTFTQAVDFTDENELIVVYPNTLCRIRPSYVKITSGIATIKIPRCRLLKPEYFKDYQDVNDRPDYTDDDYFLPYVDVYRNYLNTTTGANVVWWRHQGYICCTESIWSCDSIDFGSDVRQLAWGYLPRQRDGWVNFEPATYSSGAYHKAAAAISRCPDGLEVAYMKGYYDRYEEIPSELKRAIFAIAHNNMPQDYCSCSVQQKYYKDDTLPIEPPVRIGLGKSTWGLYDAEQIIREFDRNRNSHNGGLL